MQRYGFIKQLALLSGSIPVFLYGQSARSQWAAVGEELGEQAMAMSYRALCTKLRRLHFFLWAVGNQ